MDFSRPGLALDNKTKNRIIGALRSEFKYSPLHKAAMSSARIEVPMGKYKNGNEKYGVFYECARCKGQYKPELVQVDHINCIGPFSGSFDEWIRLAWCMGYDRGGLDNLQVLCSPCHRTKTSQDRTNMRG